MPISYSDAVLLEEIISRQSLRKPQADALTLLAEWLAMVNLVKGERLLESLAAAAELRHAENQKNKQNINFNDFERDFPSLCFALATGMGKTRLMGAFIAYLHLTGRSHNFFVLAPGTTIYKKLLADFTPGSPKYVFNGLTTLMSEPPLIVHVENYKTAATQFELQGKLRINIFNIDLFNKEANARTKPQMRKAQETLGGNYFEHLREQTDLVLLMDEAHRYRAAAGMRAIAELQPLLGLELTATPKTISKKSDGTVSEFKNILYSYGLARAINDGFVKIPFVGTRENFDPKSVSAEILEQIKLEDAVTYHHNVKLACMNYHLDEPDARMVYPFILVVAADTSHASEIKKFIESDEFFGGRFNGRTIEIHSNQSDVESAEAEARLLALELEDSTEIVIHVNKLKEGWDVSNLFTIVPLRASASEILTEQTLGRGLRLPYGRRVSDGTGNDKYALLDRLTIIAHDRFSEIIEQAKEDGSIIRERVSIGPVGDVEPVIPIEVETHNRIQTALGILPQGTSDGEAPTYRATTKNNLDIAIAAYEIIKNSEIILSKVDAQNPHKDAERIARAIDANPELSKAVAATTPSEREDTINSVIELVQKYQFPIPIVTRLATNATNLKIKPFRLERLETIAFMPSYDQITIQSLLGHQRASYAIRHAATESVAPEQMIIDRFIDFGNVNYDENNQLLFDLVKQVTDRLRSYLSGPKDVANVCTLYGDKLAEFIHEQIKQNSLSQNTASYEYRVTAGQTELKKRSLFANASIPERNFRQAIKRGEKPANIIFNGFAKCQYTKVKFDSEPERLMAVILERDSLRWLRPTREDLNIEFYTSGGSFKYEPDFIAETQNQLIIIEVKAHNQLNNELVLAKQKSTVEWCRAASEFSASQHGKPWIYCIIADSDIQENTTLDYLLQTSVA